MRTGTEFLSDHPEYLDLIARVLAHHEVHSAKWTTDYQGFEYYDVQAEPAQLRKLYSLGIVKIVYKSRACTTYRIADVDKVRALITPREPSPDVLPDQGNAAIEVPGNLLDMVIGFDDMKDTIMRSLKSVKPVHFIFIGPPSSAKSILLLCLDQIPGSQMVLGGSLTKVGLRELLLDTRPPVLLIDEIEKVENIKTLSVLLSLMATGIVIDTKSGVHRRDVMNTRVFACCNSRHGLSGELLSRFAQFVLRPYTGDEFKNIVVNVLTAREGKTPDMASYIADKVSSVMGSRDVRDALRVARLSITTDDVDKTVGVMKKYSEQIVLVHRDRV